MSFIKAEPTMRFQLSAHAALCQIQMNHPLKSLSRSLQSCFSQQHHCQDINPPETLHLSSLLKKTNKKKNFTDAFSVP